MSDYTVFQDKEYCSQQIREARETFGNKNTTVEQYDAMEKALGLMYLYCPEDMCTTVYSTMLEAERRRVHFEFHVWRNLI